MQFLNMTQKMLSKDLLVDICKESLERYEKQQDGNISKLNKLVERQEFLQFKNEVFNNGNTLTLLKGSSGQGKSILCYQLFKKQINEKNFALWIAPELTEKATSIKDIIDNAISQINPNQTIDSASRALAFTEDTPFLLIVDDINNGSNPSKILNNLINLSKVKEKEPQPNYKIICPVWPHLLDVENKKPELNIVSVGLMKESEAKIVITNILKDKNIKYNASDIKNLIQNLNCDPYLVGLLDDIQQKDIENILKTSINILDSFFASVLKDLANNNSAFSYSEYENNLLEMCYQILKLKKTKIKRTELNQFKDIEIACLRIIFNNQKICNIDDAGFIVFRHDRMKNFLYCKALERKCVNGIYDEDILLEPYYAEILGNVIANIDIDTQTLENIKQNNPVVLINSVNYIDDIETSPLLDDILGIIENYYINHSVTNSSLINDIGNALLNTTSIELVKIIRHKYSKEMKGWAYHYWLLLNFKYGDIESGATYCDKFMQVGTNYNYFEELVNVVKTNYPNLRENIIQLLSSSYSKIFTHGIFMLIGYLNIKDTDICKSIIELWQKTRNENLILPCTWAILNSFDDKNFDLLNPIFDVLKEPSEVQNDKEENTKLSDIIDYLRLAYQKKGDIYLSDNTIKALIDFADRNNLGSKISYLFSHIDNKYALEYAIQYAAKINKNQPKSFILIFLTKNWEPGRNHNSLSESTLQFLQKMWTNPQGDEDIKEIAFLFWKTGVKKDNLNELQKISKKSSIYIYALTSRIKLGDSSAVKDFIKNTKGRNLHLIANSWDKIAYQHIDKLLEHGKNKDNLADLIMRINKNDAETILEKHWKYLSKFDEFIACALHIGTTNTLELANITINKRDNNNKIKFFLWNYEGENAKIFTNEFLRNLQPYLELIDEQTLINLAMNYSMNNVNADKKLFAKLISSLNDKDKKMYLPETESELLQHLDSCLKNSWNPSLSSFFRNNISDANFDIMKTIINWFDIDISVERFKIVCQCMKELGKRNCFDSIKELVNKLEKNVNHLPWPVITSITEDTMYYISRYNL